MAADDTAQLDPEPIQHAEITHLETWYGVTAWFGFYSRRWWALDNDRLVEGATPAKLGEAVIAARGWAP